MAAAAILDFEENEKFFCGLVSRVKVYVHAKFSLNQMNRIQVIAKTFISLGPLHLALPIPFLFPPVTKQFIELSGGS